MRIASALIEVRVSEPDSFRIRQGFASHVLLEDLEVELTELVQDRLQELRPDITFTVTLREER